jgi:hypothetical protein
MTLADKSVTNPPSSTTLSLAYIHQGLAAMDHEALERKLAHLEEEILLAQSASAQGTTLLSRVALSLDDAIRVAANIRNRLNGVLPPAGRARYHVNKRPVATLASD